HRLDGVTHQLAIDQAASLAAGGAPGQQAIDGFGGVPVREHLPAIDELDDAVEGGWSAALGDRLRRAPAARLFVAERDGVNAANQIGERRVLDQVLERGAVSGADELHAAL